MKDVLGEAICDYHQGRKRATNYGSITTMAVKKKCLCRSIFGNLNRHARNGKLGHCNNAVEKCWILAPVQGSHSLALQQMGIDVTALDISPNAVAVAHQRGVNKTVHGNIFDYNASQFDTLLLLMNGIGFTGTLQGLQLFLQHTKTLLTPNGQMLFDSSDVAYLYKNNLKPMNKYYGEIEYQYQYKGKMGIGLIGCMSMPKP